MVSNRRVAVVGGGFGGVGAARFLERRLDSAWDVYLLTETNVLTYNPLLPEVVGGALLPGHAAAPIRLMFERVRVRSVRVENIDLAARIVQYRGAAEGRLQVDHLVLAVGMAANVSTIPGSVRHAKPVKTLGDALELRNTLLWRLEQATLCRSEQERRRLLTFVVIGGGFSGVEVAGQILDVVSSAARFYRNVAVSEIKLILLHRGHRLLPELSPGLSDYVLGQLVRRGIEVRLLTGAESIESDVVNLRGGGRIESCTVVSTVGSTATHLIESLGLDMSSGRVMVDECLRVPGCPGTWAIGDCASVMNAYDRNTCPPTAQFATRQAETVARNIAAQEAGGTLEAFRYRPRGQLAAIGHFNAVAELGRANGTGHCCFPVTLACWISVGAVRPLISIDIGKTPVTKADPVRRSRTEPNPYRSTGERAEARILNDLSARL
jgi:NADH dehydrogenase